MRRNIQVMHTVTDRGQLDNLEAQVRGWMGGEGYKRKGRGFRVGGTFVTFEALLDVIAAARKSMDGQVLSRESERSIRDLILKNATAPRR